MRNERLINTIAEGDKTVRGEHKRKGRNTELIHARNERLCDRIYYLRSIKRLRNEDILKQISAEFNLSTVTITEILQIEEWQTYLQTLRSQKPGKKWFKGKWGWMVW